MYDYPVPRDSLRNFYTTSISNYIHIQGVSVMRELIGTKLNYLLKIAKGIKTLISMLWIGKVIP